MYTVTETGQITNAASTYAKSTTFVLSVYNCMTSTDTVVITPSTIAPITMSLITAASGAVTVAEFTQASLYCLQSDIVYSITTSANAGQSTTFITFSSSTRVISWAPPTTAGVYTVKVTGQIANGGGSNAVT